MKKIILLSTAIATGAVMNAPAHAEISTEHKQQATVISTAVVGAVAAGPVGWIAGALGGGWMAKQIERSDQYEVVSEELASSEQELLTLRQQLAQVEQDNQQFAQLALDQLQLEMLFKTGDSQLSEQGISRVSMLADFLKANPDINIRLDGYADPRGQEDYNMALSTARAHRVAEQLESFHIDKARMEVYSHGAKFSQATTGDLDAYALERVVRIQLSHGDSGESFAQVDIMN